MVKNTISKVMLLVFNLNHREILISLIYYVLLKEKMDNEPVKWAVEISSQFTKIRNSNGFTHVNKYSVLIRIRKYAS